MSYHKRPGRGRRIGRLAFSSMLLAGVAMPQVQALENVRRELGHFIDCAGLMLSDPSAHAANCLPNSIPAQNTIAPVGGSGGVIVPPPPPPPAPDPDPGSSPDPDPDSSPDSGYPGSSPDSGYPDYAV